MTAAPPIHRFAALDAWRGICAIIVVLHHYAPANGLIGGTTVVINGFLFVDFFFVLSGFIIFHAYGSRMRTGSDVLALIWARFTRLWPLHALLLVLLIVLEIARAVVGTSMGTVVPVFSGSYSLSTLPTQLLFLESFGLNRELTWNGPSWSTAAEFLVAILFGLVCLRVPARHISIASLAIAAGSILLLFHASPQYINTAQDFGFVRCCAGFFAGVLCYRRVALSAASPPPSSLTGTMLEVATIAGVLHFLAEIGPTPSSLLAPLFFSLAVGVFALERGAISAALRHRLFQALGAWSYSIYMLQLPVFMLIYFAWRMNEKLGGAISEATATTRLHEIAGTAGLSRLLLDAPALGLLAVIILTARLSYRYVELPCQAALRSMFAGAIR